MNEFQLPAEGQETLQLWATALRMAQLENFESQMAEMSTEEKEKMQGIFASHTNRLIQDLENLPALLEEASAETGDPFKAISQLAGRFVAPLFQDAATAAGLPEEPQKGFAEMTQRNFNTTMPQILQNMSEIYSPENIKNIDAYTPFSTIAKNGDDG